MNVADVAATLAAVGALFVFTEWLRGRGLPTDATRGAAHVAGALLASTFPLYLGLADVLVVGGVATAVLGLTALRGGLRSIHAVERRTLGAVALPVGGMLTAVLVWPAPAAFSYAVLVIGLADPLAAAVGRLAEGPGWRALGGAKTLAGSAAFFVVASGLSAALAGALAPSGVLVALALAAIEGALGYGLDDLAIPIAAGVLGRTVILGQ